MIIELIVLLFGLWILRLWCRHDQRHSSVSEERLHEQTAVSLRAIGDQLDRLIEMEIASLPPEEQKRWRRKVIEAQIARLSETRRAALRTRLAALDAEPPRQRGDRPCNPESQITP